MKIFEKISLYQNYTDIYMNEKVNFIYNIIISNVNILRSKHIEFIKKTASFIVSFAA
jgi:hypothetical protein